MKELVTEIAKALVDMYKDEKEIAVKISIAAALGQAHAFDGVEPVLMPALSDPDEYLRRAATKSMNQIVGLRLPYDPGAPINERRAQIVKIKAKLPAFRSAYDAYLKRMENNKNAGT